MPQSAVWLREAEDSFHASLAEDRARKHLVVERLPEGGWDWITWLADTPSYIRQGLAASEHAAMRAAELASRSLAPPN